MSGSNSDAAAAAADSIDTAGDRKESSNGSVLFPVEEGDSDKKMRLSELLKRHPSQDPGLSSLRFSPSAKNP